MSTPGMSLDLPVVGVTPEEEWAEALNTALEVVDLHSHVSGDGVPITSAALNINADLPFNSFSLTEVESVLLDDLDADIASRGVYVKNGDLFFYNTDGDAVQVTNGASIAGSTGSITGLSSPAGAAFSSLTDTFSWTYDSSKHAKLSHSDVQIYPYNGSTAYTKAVTIKAPTALEAASNYSLTLPAALPGATEYLSIDTSGNLNHATLAGTTNQVNVSANATAITLSLPQSIHTAATPTFAGLTTTGTTTVDILKVANGSAANPVVTFDSDTNTGLYRSGTDAIGFATGGTARMILDSSGISLTGVLDVSSTVTADIVYTAAGTAANPTIAFETDTNTGIYRPDVDQVGVSVGGTNALLVSSSGLDVVGRVTATTLNTASGGAFKVALFSGTLAGLGTANHSITGSIYGVFGWNAAGGAIQPVVSSGRLYFSEQGSGSDSDTVQVTNGSGGSSSYRIVVFYT